MEQRLNKVLEKITARIGEKQVVSLRKLSTSRKLKMGK